MSTIADLAQAYLVLRDSEPEGAPEALDALAAAFQAEAKRLILNVEALEASRSGGNGHRGGIPFSTFEAALKAAGYVDTEMGAIKWGLVPFDAVPEEDKQAKLQMIMSLSSAPPVAEVKVTPKVAAQVVTTRTDRCPRCGSQGKKFEWGYSCDDRECRRPNGKHTTWDEKNHQRIAAE